MPGDLKANLSPILHAQTPLLFPLFQAAPLLLSFSFGVLLLSPLFSLSRATVFFPTMSLRVVGSGRGSVAFFNILHSIQCKATSHTSKQKLSQLIMSSTQSIQKQEFPATSGSAILTFLKPHTTVSPPNKILETKPSSQKTPPQKTFSRFTLGSLRFTLGEGLLWGYSIYF